MSRKVMGMLFCANVCNILEIHRTKYLRQCFTGNGRAQQFRWLAQIDGTKKASLITVTLQ